MTSRQLLKEIQPLRTEWRHRLVAAMIGSGVIGRQSLLVPFEKMRNLQKKLLICNNILQFFVDFFTVVPLRNAQ